MSMSDLFLSLCPPDIVADVDIRDLALRVLERCQSTISDASIVGDTPSVQEDFAKRQTFAFVTYLATALGDKTTSTEKCQRGPARSLSRILQAFGVGLEDFLKELPVVIKRAEPCLVDVFGATVPLERRLKLRELQTSFVYTTVLAKKIKDLFRSYFDLTISAQGATDNASPFFCAWLLFITAKAKLLPPFPDLVASFNLLICVLNVAIVHIPAAHRIVDLNDHSLFPVRSEGGSADTLQSLCLVNKANLTAVKALMHGMDNMLRSMGSSSTAASSTHDSPFQDLITSCSYHGGFLSEPAATVAIAEKLNAEYQQLCQGITDMDECQFLAKAAQAPSTPKPAAPPSLSRCVVGSPQSLVSPARSRLVFLSPMGKRTSSGPAETPSPYHRGRSSVFGLAQTPGIQGLMSSFHGTPVSNAMSAASWLHDMALRSPQQPTQQLLHFFRACDYDVTEQVAARIDQMAQSVLPQVPTSQHALQALQVAMTNERRSQAVKLYYGVLEAMLMAEESRTQRSNFTSLLSSGLFHKCLAACAFELVVAAYKMVTHAFPAVLEKLELHAFDLCKMIDPFVRYEPSIPHDLKCHLHSIEEKIIECLAWQRGSSLYPQLIAAYEVKTERQAAIKPEETGASDRASPAHSGNSPKSHPATPSKRKVSSGSSLHSTPNKSLKGDKDSSPSRAEDHSAAAEQHQNKSESQSHALRDSSASATSSGALASNAASTFQSADMPNPGMQSPQPAATGSAFSAFTSPVAKSAGSRASADTNFPSTTAVPRSCAFLQPAGSVNMDKPGHCILQDFLRKALRLAANRVHDLCNRLEIEDACRRETVTQVYHLVQSVIFDHTHLLFNRHLDQIVLSAIYGVCKVAQLKQISFKQIINQYRQQPQAKSDIFRTVVLKQTEPELQVAETGDVIAFYNHVFVPVVKTDLLRISQERKALPAPPQAEGLHGASPVRSFIRPDFPANGFSTPPPANRALRGLSSGTSARKVSADKQVYVSPLRSSPHKQAPAMTPRTRTLYAFVGESQQYQSPSKKFDLINGHISGHLPHVMGVQGSQMMPAQAASAVQSGSSGRSSMDASQSPSGSNSADLLRQSSTVSGDAREESGALPLLQAAADRANRWRAANQNGSRDHAIRTGPMFMETNGPAMSQTDNIQSAGM